MRIRELREQAGLTQDQVAEHMGVDQAAVHRWEIGKAMPRAAKLPELAALLHCSIDELYSRDSPPAAGCRANPCERRYPNMNPRPSSYEALPWVLTPEEVAPLLNVSMCTVYALLRSNQLKHTRIGVQYRILKQDVLAFMDQGSPAEAV